MCEYAALNAALHNIEKKKKKKQQFFVSSSWHIRTAAPRTPASDSLSLSHQAMDHLMVMSHDDDDDDGVGRPTGT